MHLMLGLTPVVNGSHLVEPLNYLALYITHEGISFAKRPSCTHCCHIHLTCTSVRCERKMYVQIIRK